MKRCEICDEPVSRKEIREGLVTADNLGFGLPTIYKHDSCAKEQADRFKEEAETEKNQKLKRALSVKCPFDKKLCVGDSCAGWSDNKCGMNPGRNPGSWFGYFHY